MLLPLRALPFLALAIAAQAANAQVPPSRLATKDWIIDRWGSDQGLPQNTVNGIIQSPDGYLWIGTYGGLVRFDGVRFTAFTTRDYPELGSDRIMRMALGPDGTLWIGTDRGLVRFANGRFHEWTEADGRPAGQSSSIFPAPDGSIWVATMVGGLARFQRDSFERFTDRGVPEGYVEKVVVDGAGNVWVYLGSPGFLIRRRGTERFVPIEVGTPRDSIQVLEMVDRSGQVWFSTAHGLARWHGSRLEYRGPRWVCQTTKPA